jgi:hypothetical protein
MPTCSDCYSASSPDLFLDIFVLDNEMVEVFME